MSAPVIFTGPSLPAAEVARRLPGTRVEPPAARGDLDRLRAEGHGTFLILDGVFAHRLALPPAEIVAALREGARVIGAASLGAIRAAECWPAGMEGCGAVYRLYRLGVIADDDEVAVATDPERGFAAISVALVNLRYAVLAALRSGRLDRARAEGVLAAARATHFARRTWPLALAGVEVDVKRRDAERAVARLARSAAFADRCLSRPVPRPPRTRGVDRYLGHQVDELRAQLVPWLLAGERGRRYQAPAGELWEVLDRTGALDGELLRWYANNRVVDS
jgi:hypothetical protein